MQCKKLAFQGVLTYCTTRTLPYHLYADECELLVFGVSLTSVGLSGYQKFNIKSPPAEKQAEIRFYL